MLIFLLGDKVFWWDNTSNSYGIFNLQMKVSTWEDSLLTPGWKILVCSPLFHPQSIIVHLITDLRNNLLFTIYTLFLIYGTPLIHYYTSLHTQQHWGKYSTVPLCMFFIYGSPCYLPPIFLHTITNLWNNFEECWK